MKPHKEAVSIIVRNGNGQFLVVKRPNDPDDDLRELWGFPAVSLLPRETETAAVKRAARTKLGITVKILRKLGENTYEKPKYVLHLIDYEVLITGGSATVPQSDTSVTQYTDCKFTDDLTILIPPPQKSHQLTRIFLDALRFWRAIAALQLKEPRNRL